MYFSVYKRYETRGQATYRVFKWSNKFKIKKLDGKLLSNVDLCADSDTIHLNAVNMKDLSKGGDCGAQQDAQAGDPIIIFADRGRQHLYLYRTNLILWSLRNYWFQIWQLIYHIISVSKLKSTFKVTKSHCYNLAEKGSFLRTLFSCNYCYAEPWGKNVIIIWSVTVKIHMIVLRISYNVFVL